MMQQKISVIVSTYNWPGALKLSLESLLTQHDNNFEVVVADDGSKDDTKQLVKAIAEKSPVKIIHAWQEDVGFRLAASRNNAVRSATGDFLIFIDGDCVVKENFLTNYRRLAETKKVIAGPRVLLSQELSAKLLAGTVSVDEFNPFANVLRRWRAGGINRISPAISLPLGSLRNVLTSRKWQVLRGCNWGLMKQDFLSVNGQDEMFQGWGLEDSDMAIRLINAGVEIKTGRFGGIPVFHIWHKQRNTDDPQKRALLEARIKAKTIYPTKGIN